MKALNAREGGPICRFGGKGHIARYIIPHFAKAKVWCEPFFGAGGVFFQLPRGVYERFLVNDLHKRLVNFFRVLRDRPEELKEKCELTLYALDDYVEALVPSLDALEDARRFWVLSRYSFSMISDNATPGRWIRPSPKWDLFKIDNARRAEVNLHDFAWRLRDVIVDNRDALDFIQAYGENEHVFIYADPPYVHSARNGVGYEHEMDEATHERLFVRLINAVAEGAKVAVSGYHNALYDRLFRSWRCVEIETALRARTDQHQKRTTRTEVLWMSYPASEEIGETVVAPTAKPVSTAERLLLGQARHRR